MGLAIKELMVSWERHITEHNNVSTMFLPVPTKFFFAAKEAITSLCRIWGINTGRFQEEGRSKLWLKG